MPYEFTLDDDEQRELLRIARTTAKEHLLSGRTPPGAPHKKSLVAPAAVFVSVHEGPALRGCIGTTQEASPIYKAVQEMAIAAATRDPRFRPVKLEELPQLRFEIAVLGPRTPMTSVADIKIGTHGLQVTSNAGPRPNRGLLLPKVAVEQGWDVETLLDKTCEKAGLPKDWWKAHHGDVELFTAQTFDELALKAGPFKPPSM
jgi:AmmeMemoRadiSam system protein A